MPKDRFQKVYDALAQEFPSDGDVSLCVGLGEIKPGRDALVAFQESAEIMETDSVRQTRTIGVRLVGISSANNAPRSKEILRRAANALRFASNIRVFSMTGPSTDLDEDGPAAEGVFTISQRVDVR